MSLIYRALRVTFRIAIDLYFVEVHATGLETIPKEGPVLFAANHPNSLMDAIILSMKTSREVSFLGRSGLFSNPLSSRMLHSVGVIPIYRRSDDPSQIGSNAESFQRAYEVLAEGGAIGIFPEGHNSPEHHVAELRTGAARIALEAEEKYGWSLGLTIVPVGISYEDRDAFLSAALVRFGEPIQVGSYRGAYAADPRAVVDGLTNAVGQEIRGQALHIADGRLKDLTGQLWEIAGARMLDRYLEDDAVSVRPKWRGFIDQLRSTVEPRPEIDGVFVAKRALADALERVRRERPRDWMLLRNAAHRHLDHVHQLHLRDEIFRRDPSTTRAPIERIKLTAYAIVFGPLAAWGFIANLVPYQVVKQIARSRRDEAKRAVTGAAVGLTIGPVLYATGASAIWRAGTPVWLTVAILASMIPSGFFFLRYRAQVAKYRNRILARILFRRRRGAIESVFSERRAVIDRLESLLNADEANTLLPPRPET